MALLAAALDILFPPRCPGCGAASQADFCSQCDGCIAAPRAPLCASCGLPLGASPFSDRCRPCLDHPPAFRSARACATYSTLEERPNPLRTVLHRFKYERDLAAAGPLARLLASRHTLDATQYDVVVPVPLHLDRLRWRGFNQAQQLAAPLARRAGVGLDPFALERMRATQPQVRLDAAQRRRNVHNAFRVRRPAAVRDRRVLLFDDVYTSGATVDACARVLLAAGARSVDVLALAHAVLP